MKIKERKYFPLLDYTNSLKTTTKKQQQKKPCFFSQIELSQLNRRTSVNQTDDIFYANSSSLNWLLLLLNEAISPAKKILLVMLYCA